MQTFRPAPPGPMAYVQAAPYGQPVFQPQQNFQPQQYRTVLLAAHTAHQRPAP
eukprot:CAMPEP_0204363102 /NCGR_PEP_ID=MMETSP0469-20131031/40122_1 /ASSEMBLY_ACC=CAM_ASM_000384 /TAXON_ID=2969 /ORGANISM="Oxyrrhis marina" /LENGTH=52 /DNA_ID=CAMNT_0051351803 /DNA_START=5 /DNA_END=160 /DNA_ORIENTATION=+